MQPYATLSFQWRNGKTSWWSVPGRLAQPALPLQKIAAFDSLADSLRSQGHVPVKFLEGQGSGCWQTVSVLLDGNRLKSRRKPMATRPRVQDAFCSSSFKAFRHAITKCSFERSHCPQIKDYCVRVNMMRRNIYINKIILSICTWMYLEPETSVYKWFLSIGWFQIFI